MSGELRGILSPFLRRRRFIAATPYIRGRILDWGCGTGRLCRGTEPSNYLGVDIDASVIATARSRYPKHTFVLLDEFDDDRSGRFDTIVALAVIEHVPDPVAFLQRMASVLALDGRIVLTTPNPRLDWAHGLGGWMGLCARESHAEHQSLMNREELGRAAAAAGLVVQRFRRFLLGANQLAVLTR